MSILRSRFGIPGAIAVIALVFAMFGGAYAASDGGDGNATASAKKKNPKKGGGGAAAAKRFSMQFSKRFSRRFSQQFAIPGAPGLPGPQGPEGPEGSEGDRGDKGNAGAKGATGPAGPQGPQGAQGPQGVQGPQGPEGPEGSPWSAGGTLPVGETETGVYVFDPDGGEAGEVIRVPLSFAIPLASKIEDNAHIVYGPPGTDPVNCPGTVENPTAASGYLCIYELDVLNANGIVRQNLGTSGVLFGWITTGPDAEGRGAWAVTG